MMKLVLGLVLSAFAAFSSFAQAQGHNNAYSQIKKVHGVPVVFVSDREPTDSEVRNEAHKHIAPYYSLDFESLPDEARIKSSFAEACERVKEEYQPHDGKTAYTYRCDLVLTLIFP